MKLYELYSGEDLKVAEKIQQRRLQLLIHSYIYYELDKSIIADSKWSDWAVQLLHLQQDYPDIAKHVMWSDEFKDWDASTGAFLPLQDEWVIATAQNLLNAGEVKKPVPKAKPKTKVGRPMLF